MKFFSYFFIVSSAFAPGPGGRVAGIYPFFMITVPSLRSDRKKAKKAQVTDELIPITSTQLLGTCRIFHKAVVQGERNPFAI